MAVKDTREDGMRYSYRGKVFDSVTTILGGSVPKPALQGWAARMVAQWCADNLEQFTKLCDEDPADAVQIAKGAPYKSTNRAAVRGSHLHAAAEAHAKGEELPEVPKNAEGMVRSFLRFIDEYQPEPILTEVKVFNLTYDYAGTLDAIVTIDFDEGDEQFPEGGKRNILLDYKTGKGVYPETALQLAAYRYAEFYLDDDGKKLKLPHIDGCAVVHVRPRSYAYHPLTADEEIFKFFRACRKVFDFTQDGNKLVGLRR
jgi:hypothetical protein